MQDGSTNETKYALAKNILPDGSVTADKLVEAFLKGRRQDDDANSISDSAVSGLTVQMGWGQIQGDGTPRVTDTVTFEKAFSSVPLVLISSLGLSAGGTAATIAGLNTTASAGNHQAVARSISTANFVAQMIRDTGSNTSSSNYYGFAWIAIGVVA